MSIALGKRVVAQTAAQSVYETLRDRIISLDLPPLAHLSRNELAAQLGVSLTPLREAMAQLELDGLIQVFPQSKTIVSQINVRKLRETHFLRQAVETEVVRALALGPDSSVIARAKALVQMQQSLIGQGDQMDLFTSLDREFHRTLFDAVGMGDLYEMVIRRQGHLARCQRLDLSRGGKIQKIVKDHNAILNAIEKGEPALATQAMRDHLSGTIVGITQLRQTYPEYFTENV